jgi:16S rRNA A1518/A1519 N6-dimethyltransferase RsmA/KsgA/DIM1 with predicted DNA glycosylase/AP lyase activity
MEATKLHAAPVQSSHSSSAVVTQVLPFVVGASNLPYNISSQLSINAFHDSFLDWRSRIVLSMHFSDTNSLCTLQQLELQTVQPS